ncbi:protein SCAF11 isoform X2 [Scleropages formosus]|uniref:protein SCAF11 isoform X2 n=1 Tax=Scleropages formosus TaxID=113540 RepID=UPI0010FAB409|nr:protein SCAF11 isoform X2 [Scleropages formosus]
MADGTRKGGNDQEDALDAAPVVVGDEADKCPICLNPLLLRDLAILASCCHSFCLRCILQWAEIAPSCPVDRRPFSIVYKRDTALGYIKIPVKKTTSKTSLETCGCNKRSEKERRSVLRREFKKKLTVRGNWPSHPKVNKDSERKCDSVGCSCKQDLSALKKKVIRDPCSPWPLPPYAPCSGLGVRQNGTPTCAFAELISAYEEEPLIVRKYCGLEVQGRAQLTVPAAVSTDILSWQSAHSRDVSRRRCSLGFPVPGSAVPLSVVGWLGFQGRVCAVTYTKGDEKKGTRSTDTKGSKNNMDALPKRCSARNSRLQESHPTQEPCSSQSGHSDSNSLSDPSPTAGGGSKLNSKPTGKRKPKQVAKRKPSVKKNTRARRKSLQESQNSSEEVDDQMHQDLGDEEKQKEDEDEGEEEENIAERVDSLVSDSEELVVTAASAKDLNVKDDCSESLYHSTEHEDKTEVTENLLATSNHDTTNDSIDGEEAVYQNNIPPSSEEQVHKREDLENLDIPLSAEEALKKTEMSVSEDNVSASDGGNDSVICSPPSFPEHEEIQLSLPRLVDRLGDADIAVCCDINEDTAKEEVMETSGVKQPKEHYVLSGNQNDGFHQSQGLEISKSNFLQEKGNAPCPEVMDSLDIERASNVNFVSEDNTEMVPMDCDSPKNDHDEFTSEPKVKNENTVCVNMVPASDSQDSEACQRPTEGEEVSVEQKEQGANRQRRSRFHSPSTTWSPKSKKEQEQSEFRSKDNASRSKAEQRRSRSRSRDRDRDRDWDRTKSWSSRYRSRASSRDRDGQKSEEVGRNRHRERAGRRRSRTRSRSRSRTRSRSRSRSWSRNRGYGRGSSVERTESSGRSPRRRDRRDNDGRRNHRGSYQQRRHDQEKPSNSFSTELAESESQREASLEWARAKNPDWVKEKMNADSEARGQSVGTNSPRWEEGCNNGVGDSWTRSTKQGGWNPDHRRSSGWGQRGEPTQNWWQARNSSFSGSSNHSGNDSYSRFNENRFNRRKGETDHSEPPVDRSGWSSASSWAVCRTLPADVQDYYSRRGRGSAASGGGWNRQEETAVQEPPQSEPNTQGSGGPQLPVNMMHHPQYPPQAVGPQAVGPQAVGPQAVGPQAVAPLLPFPASAHGQPLKLPPGPFAVPQQVPMFIHPPVPLLRVPVATTQGLPPPPPPPPPIQQVDGHSAQKVLSSVTSQGGSRPGGTVAPGPSKAQGSVSQGVPGVALPSSTTQPRSTDKRPASKGSADGDTHADSSKKEKKLQIQEKAVQEVKMAIKPYYQNKDITKEEYKEIVRKAVEKVCHSRSGEVNSGKVANLVKAYVEKYKHDRRNKSENHKS